MSQADELIAERRDYKKKFGYRGIIFRDLHNHPIHKREVRGHNGNAHFDLADNKAIDAHISELPPGGKSNRHRHLDEAIIYILCGRGYSVFQLEGKAEERYDWQAGDLISPPLYAWHQHFNADPEKPARYLAITNTPLMESLGVFTKEETGWKGGERHGEG